MAQIFGGEVSNRSILLSQIHNVIEIATMAGWLALVMSGRGVAGFIVLAVGLTVEHVLALAAGKLA